MFRSERRVVSGLLLVMLAMGCSHKKESTNAGEKVYAAVNEAQLTEPGLRELVPSDFYDKLTPEHKKEIVNEWVNSELLYQESLRMKLDQDPEIRQIIENARRTLLINEFIERKFEALATPPIEELRKFYESHKQYFALQEREYHIRYAAFDSKRDADEFRKLVKNRGGFSEMAKERSKDQSAQSGGDLGVVNEEMVSPQIWQAADATLRRYGKVKISDAFQVDNGWGCLIVDEVFEPGSPSSFESVRDRVLDMYMTESREKARTELLRKLASGAKITYGYENESGK